MNRTNIIVATMLVVVAGCARLQPVPVTVTSGTVDYVYAAPPYDIETRPYVMYNGVPNYYSDGLWYRRTGQGWGYYRNEPAPLMQRRPVRVQSAPPAYRVGPQQAPPAYRRPR